VRRARARGEPDTAYRLLLQRECPSWLYSVTMGATTVWERWDSMLPDGSINPGEMTSFNHYALGAVADWLHRTVAGLAPAAPATAAARRAAARRRPAPRRRRARDAVRPRRGALERGGRRAAVDVLVPPGRRRRSAAGRGRGAGEAARRHRFEVAVPGAERGRAAPPRDAA
jgi:alpha-L-rhamnosidase